MGPPCGVLPVTVYGRGVLTLSEMSDRVPTVVAIFGAPCGVLPVTVYGKGGSYPVRNVR